MGEQLSPYSVLPNLALICDRGSKVSLISNLFVTNMLCDLHANGSGELCVFVVSFNIGKDR
ncbi:adenine specific DNA methyltransferase [Helicobacter pylori]|uniref:adenine specific DNA methyltransferase n=1 Tax=Helicobacter pylori TaxID=210 RepID=UPI000957D90D|nr:adenine specific DNA methyltransferase [Helicobacter pylori]BAW72825.1 adenine specific DNA methyltransferase [Helicobacter pylori]